MKQEAIKSSNEDRDAEQMKKEAQVKVTREEEEAPKAKEAQKCDDKIGTSDEEYDTDPPSEFECNITGELMRDPVLLPRPATQPAGRT